MRNATAAVAIVLILGGCAAHAGAQGAATLSNGDGPLEQGLSALQGGQPQQALAFFKQAITADPQSAPANLLAASAETALYDGADAVRYAERAAALEPDNWKTHTTLVTAYAMVGDVAHRDAERATLRKDHDDPALPDARGTSGFLLDRFRVRDYRVDAVEYFHPLGKYNTYFRFIVSNADGARVWTIEGNSDSLNQASWSQAYPRQAAEGQRQYQIESAPGEAHVDYSTFSGAPSYDYLKAQIVKILTAQTAPFPAEPTGK